jgi:dimethylamine/trimethylamine dehydrogenase
VLESGIRDVILATGATWRRDGIGRSHWKPIHGSAQDNVFSPDDLMAGKLPSGKVLIFDDDHYYMGGVLAELLVEAGCQVTLATPAPLVSAWTQYTLEQERIHKRLVQLGVRLMTQMALAGIGSGVVTLAHVVSGSAENIPCDAVVLVTDRLPNDALYQELKPSLAEGWLQSLRVIGDAEAPHIIAQAVYSGHLAAREFDEEKTDGTPFRMERIALDQG